MGLSGPAVAMRPFVVVHRSLSQSHCGTGFLPARRGAGDTLDSLLVHLTGWEAGPPEELGQWACESSAAFNLH